MRVCWSRKSASSTRCTPATTSASISSRTGSLAPDIGPRRSPTYSAACDQVDWVRYLIALERRLVPSTSSTSPTRRVAARCSGGKAGSWLWPGRGVAASGGRLAEDQGHATTTSSAPGWADDKASAKPRDRLTSLGQPEIMPR